MKKNWPLPQILLLSAISIVIAVVLGTVVMTNTTLRSVEKNLPSTLIRELAFLDRVVEQMADVVLAAEITAMVPSSGHFERLEGAVRNAFEGVSSLRQTFVFDNLVQASAFHSVAAPAIADLQIWLSEGVSGYAPRSKVTAGIILSRISSSFEKAKSLNRQSRLNAQKKLEKERTRLDSFLSSVNLLFLLTVLISFIVIFLFFRQHGSRIRELNVQNALKEQSEVLNSLFDNILLGITVCSSDGRFLFANPSFIHMTGYDLEDVPHVEDWFSKAYPDPEYRQKVQNEWNESATQKNAVREFRITCKNGRKKDIEFRAAFLPDGRALVTLSDVTETRKARAALKENEQRMRAILESGPEPIVEYDREGHPRYINPAFTDVFGWTMDELKGARIPFVPKDQEALTAQKIKEVFTKAEPIRFETRRYTKDRRLLDIFCSAAETRASDGTATGMVAHLTDITQIKSLETQYEQAQKMESLGTLAGGIAHDFNNLLSGIYGYLDLARRKTTEPKIREYLTKAHNSSERATGLTQQLLTFSKGGEPVKKVESLVPFLRETTEFALSGSSVSCSFELSRDLWSCDYDKNQLAQVIDNMVINAHHAMPSGGNLQVTAVNVALSPNTHHGLPKGNYVKISLTDTGTGIPEKYMTRIFDPFFTTKQKGSGLGLATSYSIVRRHGGKIEVESEPGVGTSFLIFLPAAETHQKEENDIVEIEYQGTGKILIMDDEGMIREMLGSMLEDMGFTTIQTSEGSRALTKYRAALEQKDPFSAIILDLTVPGGMGGKQVVKEIRKTDPDTPIFVASGYSEDATIADPGQFGFTASIEKPFTILKLAQVFELFLKS